MHSITGLPALSQIGSPRLVAGAEPVLQPDELLREAAGLVVGIVVPLAQPDADGLAAGVLLEEGDRRPDQVPGFPALIHQAEEFHRSLPLLLGLLALGDVVNDREQQGFPLRFDGRRIDLHPADLSRGDAMGEHEMVPLLLERPLPFGGHLLGRQLIELLNFQPAQFFAGMPVELGGSGIGIHDGAALRFDQEHDRLVALEHVAETLLALPQRLHQGVPFRQRPGQLEIAVTQL